MVEYTNLLLCLELIFTVFYLAVETQRSAPMQVSLRRNGFTLVELLTVIAIISVLAALLFPVFLTVRGKAREISCIANMHQVGLSLKMYTQDYDEMFPWAVDPTDKYTPQIWNQYPQFKEQIEFMPMQHEALQPYVKSAESF